MREEAASEADKVNQDNVGEDDKDDNKQTKLKPKQSSHKTKGNQQNSSLKKVDIPDDNLDEYFSSSQDKNSQDTADVTLTEALKQSEEAESKEGAQNFQPWKCQQVTSRFRW